MRYAIWRYAALLIFSFGLFVSPASAQRRHLYSNAPAFPDVDLFSFENNGNNFLIRCEHTVNHQPKLTPEIAIQNLACTAWVRGLVEAVIATSQACIPENSATQQWMLAILNNMKTHPKHLNLPTRVLATAALRTEWPCK
jgi:hypothetical protein